MMNIKVNLWDSCIKRPLKGKQTEIDYKHVFDIGIEKISKDIGLFNIIQTLNKLKATVGVLVGENTNLFTEIEKNYNDAVFFQHSYKQADDELRKEVLECRLDIATTKIDRGRTQLEDYIYN